MIQVFTKAMFCSAVIYGLFAAVHAQQRNPCDDEGGYDYPTKLKGEYRLVFETDREIKYLNLYKGIRRIRRLSDVSCGLPNKNLGYIGTDFQNYFVLVHSFRSGNPHEIELIRKSDGKNILVQDACWIDSSERYSVLLYSEDCTPDQSDRIVLLNVGSGKKLFFRFPKFILSDGQVLGKIKIDSISKSRFTLRFEDFQRKIVKSLAYRY